MIAYKATHNFKCRNQEYKVGKTYTADRMKICEYGFHFCQKMEDVLYYYNPTKDFILLEIEVLGEIETEDNKSVTDKFKVLRVIPYDEYTNVMKSRLSRYEYDDKNNMISTTCPNGNKITFEYDDRDNMISMTYPSGIMFTFEYDERNNMISKTYQNGAKYTFEYDEKNNGISETDSYGAKYTYEYAVITEE